MIGKFVVHFVALLSAEQIDMKIYFGWYELKLCLVNSNKGSIFFNSPARVRVHSSDQ